MKSPILTILVVSAAVLAGCKHRSNSVSGAPVVASADASPNDAIRTAIQAHLAHNGNLSLKSFDTDVKQITLKGNNAQAQVEFHVKNGPGTMQLSYSLTKRDDTWSVVGSTPGGSNFSHPALDKGRAPAESGTTFGDSSISHVLDSLHGRAATKSHNLPPGHPPIAASGKTTSPQTP